MTMVMQDQGEDDDLGRQERNVGHDPEAVKIVEAREYGVEQRYHAGQHQPRMEGDVTLLNESRPHQALNNLAPLEYVAQLKNGA